jgi:hypothetical protein
MLPRIRISLRDVGPWAAIDKIVDERIEVLDVLLCVNERQPGAVEQVTHG